MRKRGDRGWFRAGYEEGGDRGLFCAGLKFLRVDIIGRLRGFSRTERALGMKTNQRASKRSMSTLKRDYGPFLMIRL
jgi:hypothetical protein